MKKFIFIVGMSLSTVAMAQEACRAVFTDIKTNIAASTKAMAPINNPFVQRYSETVLGKGNDEYLMEIPTSDGQQAYFLYQSKTTLIYNPITRVIESKPLQFSKFGKRFITQNRYATILNPQFGDPVPQMTLKIYDVKTQAEINSFPIANSADFGIKSNNVFWLSRDKKSVEYINIETGIRSSLPMNTYIQQVMISGNSIVVRTGNGLVSFYNSVTKVKESEVQLEESEYINTIVKSGVVTTQKYNKIIPYLTYPHHHPANKNDHLHSNYNEHHYPIVHHQPQHNQHQTQHLDHTLGNAEIENHGGGMGHRYYGDPNTPQVLETRIHYGKKVLSFQGDIIENSVSENGRYLAISVSETFAGASQSGLKVFDLQTETLAINKVVDLSIFGKNALIFVDAATKIRHVFDMETGKTVNMDASLPASISIVGITPGTSSAVVLASEFLPASMTGTESKQIQRFYYTNFLTGKSTPLTTIIGGYDAPKSFFDGKSLMIGTNVSFSVFDIKDSKESPEANLILNEFKQQQGKQKSSEVFESALTLFEVSPFLALNVMNRVSSELPTTSFKLKKGTEDKIAKVVTDLRASKALDVSGVKLLIEFVKTAKDSLGAKGKDITTDLANMLLETVPSDPVLMAFEIPQYNMFKMIKESLRKDFGMPYEEMKDIFVLRDKPNKMAKVIAMGTESVDGQAKNAFGFSVKQIAEYSTTVDGTYTASWKAGDQIAKAKLRITSLNVKDLTPDSNPAPNYKEMLADKNLGGAIVITKNIADFSSDMTSEYLDYYKKAKFKLSAPKVIDGVDAKTALLKEISEGKLDYVVREGHSEFSTELAMTLSEQVQVYKGSRVGKNGTTETIDIIVSLEKPKPGTAEAPISYAELGDRLRDRQLADLDLIFLQTSCWGACATQQHITDVGSKALIPIASTAMVDTFTNESTSQIYQIIEGIRHMKSYEDIRVALKPTEDPTGFRFPDQADYLASQQGEPDSFSVRIEIKRNFKVETPKK